MSNDIKVTVSIEEFEAKKPPEQSSLIYKAVSATQLRVESLDGRIGKLETNRKLEKAKIMGIAIGSAGGTAGFISWVKSWFVGG